MVHIVAYKSMTDTCTLMGNASVAMCMGSKVQYTIHYYVSVESPLHAVMVLVVQLSYDDACAINKTSFVVGRVVSAALVLSAQT